MEGNEGRSLAHEWVYGAEIVLGDWGTSRLDGRMRHRADQSPPRTRDGMSSLATVPVAPVTSVMCPAPTCNHGDRHDVPQPADTVLKIQGRDPIISHLLRFSLRSTVLRAAQFLTAEFRIRVQWSSRWVICATARRPGLERSEPCHVVRPCGRRSRYADREQHQILAPRWAAWC
jgi:hypothetical protein